MSARRARVLVLEDDPALSEVLCDELDVVGYDARPAPAVASGREQLGNVDFDVALLDLQLPDGSGLDLLRLIQAQGLATECIILTGHGSVDSAVEAMKLGAYDFLSKPVAIAELLALVEKAADKARLRRENASLRARLERQGPAPEFVAHDPRMREVVAQAQRAASSDISVVLEGPPGSGRAHLARCVLARDADVTLPFVTLDCRVAAEPLEAELFGREGTSGDRRQALIDVADGGVLFLDAVQDMDETLLLKLLRATEAGEFRAVDGKRTNRCRVRLVVSSTRNLAAEAARGGFSREAWQRLDGLTLALPALASRPDDVVPLARYFLAAAAPTLVLDSDAEEVLAGYAWPGNVRELRAVMQRAALLAQGGSVEAGAIQTALGGPGEWSAIAARGGLTLEELQREYIHTVLRQNEGETQRAAQALGVPATDIEARLTRRS